MTVINYIANASFNPYYQQYRQNVPKEYEFVWVSKSDSRAMGLARKTQQANGGEKPGFNFAIRPGAPRGVLVIPTFEDPETHQTDVVFLKTYRDGHAAISRSSNYQGTIDCVAGMVGDKGGNLSEEEYARAELAEEAGLKADDIVLVAEDVPAGSGYLAENFDFYTARNAQVIAADKRPQLEVGETDMVKGQVAVPLNKVTEWLAEKKKQGYAISSNIYTALFLLLQEENKNQNPFNLVT